MSGFEGEPIRLTDALERVLGSLDAPPADLLATVFQQWEEVVGADVARHCRPTAIEDGRLTVLASDSLWASEVQWLANEVLARINKMSATGKLESVIVRVAPARK